MSAATTSCCITTTPTPAACTSAARAVRLQRQAVEELNRCGGGPRQHPADLRRADPGAVAGGGMVGADAKTNSTAGCRGCCAAAATASPRCRTGARRDISDEDAWAVFARWEAAGGPAVEESVIAARVRGRKTRWPPSGLAVRHFHRAIDTAWRRTSYSALVRGAEAVARVSTSEPEVDRPRRRGRGSRRHGAGRRAGRRHPRWRPCRRVRRSARWCTRCWRPPIPVAADLAAELEAAGATALGVVAGRCGRR